MIDGNRKKQLALSLICLPVLLVIAACSGGAVPGAPAAIPTAVGKAPAQGMQGKAYPAPQAGEPLAAYPGPKGEAGVAGQTGTKTVTFTSTDGVKLVGTFYTPVTANAPGLVLIHMVARQRTDWDELASLLQSQGFAVLTFDLRGHGDSSGSRDWTKMTEDVAGAYRFLIDQPGVDSRRIGLVGASIGANLAVNFAAAERGVKAIVLLSPGLDYRGVKTEAAMQQYGDRPVFLAASRTDAYAAQSVATLGEVATGEKKAKIYDDAGHGTQMLGKSSDLSSLIVEWLKSTLL